jgi:N-acetylneuraminic acid mutarotase
MDENTMKLLALIFLVVSCASRADYVFMKETQDSKTIQLVNSKEVRAINDLGRKEWALYPDITPDGEEVVYCEGTDQANLHLTVLNLRTKKSESFTPAIPGMVLHPKFTKNKKMIFFSAPGKNGKNNIHFMGRDFKEQILNETEEAYFPRPSADGSFVVYQRNTNGKKEIILFDRTENESKVIAEGMSPSLSFDERLIAFTSKKEGSWDVYVFNRDTEKVERMTSEEKDEMAPTFKPDNTLVVASNKSGHFRLYFVKNKALVQMATFDFDGDWDAYAPQFSGETKYVQGDRAQYLGNPRSSFGTVSHEGMIYMAGGHQGAEHTYPEESFSDQFIKYDIGKNEWSELAPRPVKAHGYQIAAHGNYIYAFGGFAYSEVHKPKWKSLDLIHRYDIRTNKWEEIGKLSVPRSSNVAVTINGKVILAAGWDSTPKKENDVEGTFLDSVEIFDLETEKIELAPYKIPMPLRRALTGVELDGKVVMVGGLGVGASHFELLQKVTSFDPTTGASTELAPLPFATFAPAAEILNGELFVFGGMFKTGEMNYEYVSHIYGMNLKNQTWRHTGRSLQETKGFSQVFHVDSKTLGVLGGHRYFEGFDSPVKTFETFK